MQYYKFSKVKELKTIFIYLLLFLAGDFFSSLPFDLLFSIVKLPIRELYSIIRITSCLLFTYFLFWFYTTKILHLKMKDFRITFDIKKWGIAFAIFLPTFVVSLFLLIGKTSVNDMTFMEIILIIIASLIRALKAGLLEEMLFRGYIMKLLENKWSKGVAIVLPSILFSVLHLPSMGTFNLTSVLCLLMSGTLVGIMFSLVTYKGDSISHSVLLHTIWNFVMVSDLLHITTLQGTYGKPFFSIIIPSDHVLLTGGGFGVEASIIAMMGYGLICGFTLLKRNKCL